MRAPVIPQPLHARMEEAALNATVVREQMLYDGWLVRWADAKARRARSINVIAAPQADLDEKLAFCASLYQRHGRPFIFRITSSSADPALDGLLAQRGWSRLDETRVMAASLDTIDAATQHTQHDTGPRLEYEQVDSASFAEHTGRMRAYTPEHVREHARRLAAVAVPSTCVLARDEHGQCVAAGLAVVDGDLVGIFDVVVQEEERRRGHARALAGQLLNLGRQDGARTAYLQVENSNMAARALYGSLGFSDQYEYWYRAPPHN